MWYRVFGRSGSEPLPAALAAYLHAVGLEVEPHFRGDDLGWTTGELRLPGTGTSVVLQRYTADADDIRDDLNSHAAELEATGNGLLITRMMAHVIQTRQLFTLSKPIDATDEVVLERVLDETCRFLAAATDGVFQIDGRGWFTAAGELWLREY